MKKAAVLLLALVLFVPQISFAAGFVKEDMPIWIAVNYLKWARDCFNVTDLREEFDGYLDGNDDYSIVDDLIIVDHRKKEVIQYVKMNYLNDGKDESQQTLRAMSMFASIEYGAPGEWTDPQTLQAISACYAFASALRTALLEHAEELADGKPILFYKSERFTYVISKSIDEGTAITAGGDELVPEEADHDNNGLASVDSFLASFNTSAALMETGHTLSVENAEISRFSNFVLLKSVFHNCEILSLRLNMDSSRVMSVQCTYSTLVPNASSYADDFVCLLMETMYACGIDADSTMEALSNTGFLEHYAAGDTGETTVNGIKISYEVTSVFGASFTIEKVG